MHTSQAPYAPPGPQVHMDAEGNPTKQPGKVSSAFILKHCPVEVRLLQLSNTKHRGLVVWPLVV